LAEVIRKADKGGGGGGGGGGNNNNHGGGGGGSGGGGGGGGGGGAPAPVVNNNGGAAAKQGGGGKDKRGDKGLASKRCISCHGMGHEARLHAALGHQAGDFDMVCLHCFTPGHWRKDCDELKAAARSNAKDQSALKAETDAVAAARAHHVGDVRDVPTKALRGAQAAV
jgi:hypothetical protein